MSPQRSSQFFVLRILSATREADKKKRIATRGEKPYVVEFFRILPLLPLSLNAFLKKKQSASGIGPPCFQGSLVSSTSPSLKGGKGEAANRWGPFN